jgi:hypothetical protein
MANQNRRGFNSGFNPGFNLWFGGNRAGGFPSRDRGRRVQGCGGQGGAHINTGGFQNRGHQGGWTANRGRAPSSYQVARGQAFGPAQTNAMATFGSASAHPVANDQAEAATGTGFSVGSGSFTHVGFGPQAGPNATRGTLIFGVPMGSTGGNEKAATTDVPGGGGFTATASTTKGPGGSSPGGTLVSGTSGVNLYGVPTSDGDAKTEEARESSMITRGGGLPRLR